MADTANNTGKDRSDPNVKVWIGNIDHKLTEYQLLKILEKFGKITSFDFLYHINDRGQRIPRGYAFATFQSVNCAAEAIKSLHKKKILTKELLVRYASSKGDTGQKIHEKLIPLALRAGSAAASSDSDDAAAATTSKLSQTQKEKQIRELEAKLRQMENSFPNTEAATAAATSSLHRTDINKRGCNDMSDKQKRISDTKYRTKPY